MLIAVAVLLTLFTGCAFFIVLLQRDELAKDVQYFLIKNKITRNVVYKSLSVPLSDKVRLNDVEIRFSPILSFPNKIKSVSVGVYEEQRTVPSALAVSLKGVRFKISEAIQSRNRPEDEVINTFAGFDPVSDVFRHLPEAFLLAGCDSVNADADVRYAYNPDTRKMTLAFDARDRCLGRWQFSVSMDDISNAQQGRLAAASGHLLKKGDPVADIQDFLNGATVTSLSFSYTETQLVKGYKKYVDSLYLRLPGRPSPAEIDTKGLQSIVSYLSFSSPHRQRNTETAKRIAEFVKKPQTLVIQSKPGKSVSLKSLRGDALRRFVELLLKLDVTVKTDDTVFGQ